MIPGQGTKILHVLRPKKGGRGTGFEPSTNPSQSQVQLVTGKSYFLGSSLPQCDFDLVISLVNLPHPFFVSSEML